MDRLYRAVWRWHFYAGLIVLPVLVWLAGTGALYLYKPELERLLIGELIRVAERPALPAGRIAADVERATGARVTALAIPAAPGESWRATIALPDGGRRTAYVDPGDGRLLGTTREGGPLRLVRDLHSLTVAGPVGNALIEIVAGWTIILVVTGLYLWWPRRGTPALALRGSPGGRLFWRDLHAGTGALAGVLILFLATTGLPWSVFLGKQVQTAVAGAGLGRPRAPGPAPWEQPAAHHALPWSLERRPAPDAAGAGDVGLDRVLAIAAARGATPPLLLVRPAAAEAPYLVSRTAGAADAAHVVYVEPASGRVLQDARARDFGAGARAIEWGIATHQGLQYGEPNRLLMLAACLAVLLLAATAPMLWWRRGLAVPPRPAGRARGLAALMLGLGVLLPLTGLTMAAAMIGERVWTGARARRASG
jgi:uncharacterized iron-regulated membrane protein